MIYLFNLFMICPSKQPGQANKKGSARSKAIGKGAVRPNGLYAFQSRFCLIGRRVQMNCRLPPGQLSHYSLISGFLQCIHNNFSVLFLKAFCRMSIVKIVISRIIVKATTATLPSDGCLTLYN
jgi:hypothetical protein